MVYAFNPYESGCKLEAGRDLKQTMGIFFGGIVQPTTIILPLNVSYRPEENADRWINVSPRFPFPCAI